MKPGDLVGGKYRVERVIGAGGMGVVVAARHAELGQEVALKFILPESISGKGAVERFMREARSVARLRSDHVARVFDVGRDENDNPYMVLELLEGFDLAKLNKQKGPFAVADAIEYVLQCCEALVEAHTAGIVHRDLKPQNIFVSRRLNGTPLVKVLDFGIAKAVGAAAAGQVALTDSQSVIGSPLYMAPEHMRSARAADVRSDIWSLGVILYELLGGELPFDGETVTEVCIRVVNEQPASLLALRPGLEPRLVDIVMRCLEKDPSARWQNVAQLACALEPFARSAQTGGVVRPWRSLEDTMDPSPQSSGRGANQDDVEAATARTMPTDPEVPQSSFRGETVRSFSPPPVPPLPVTTESANVSWGRRTDPVQQGSRARFAKGMAVGAAIAIAAAVAIVAGFRSQAVATLGASASPPQTSAPAASPPAAPPAAEPTDAPLIKPAAAEEPSVKAAASEEPSVAAARPTPAARPTAPAKPRSTPSVRSRPAAAASQPSPQPADPPATPAANGAPILR